MNTAQKIVKNATSLLVSGIIAQFLGFLAIVYLARVLCPADFGKISFAMAIVIYFTVVANLGLPLLGTKKVARERGKIRDYLGSILTLRLCLAVLGFGLLLLMTLFLDKPADIKYLLILYGLGLIPSALLLDWAFQGVERMEYIGLGRILVGATFLALVMWFIKNPGQLLLAPCFQVAGNLLAAGVLIPIFVGHFGKPRFKFDLVLWKSLFRQALPIGFALLMIQIYYNVDTVMLGFMKSNEEVGYYNAAYKIVMFLILLIGAYYDAIFPVVSYFYKMSSASLKSLLSLTVKLMVTIAIPLVVMGTILARPIMDFIFGARYESGIIALQILIWAVAIIWVNGVYSRGLLSCDRQNKFAMGVTVAAIINVILNFILIPPLGIKGAAIATVSAEAVATVVFYIEFSKVIRVPLHNYIVKPSLASVIMALFLYWGLVSLNLHVFVLIFGGIAIYFVFLYLIKGITKAEIRSLQSAILGIK